MLDKMALGGNLGEGKFQGIACEGEISDFSTFCLETVGQVGNYSAFRLHAYEFLFAEYLLVKNQRAVLFDQFVAENPAIENGNLPQS